MTSLTVFPSSADLLSIVFAMWRRLFIQFEEVIPGIPRLLHVYTEDKTMKSANAIRNLWESHIHGDMSRFNQYYLPCHKRLTMFCLGKLKDLELAENAASDTLVKLMQQESPEEIRDIESWLFTVARNQCLTYLNKENNRRDIRDKLQVTWTKEQRPEGEDALGLQDMQSVISSTLSEKDHKIWTLHLEGFRNEEIAEQMGMPEKTVANRKSEARRKLRKALAHHRM